MTKKFNAYVLACLTLIHQQQTHIIRRLNHQEKEMNNNIEFLCRLLERDKNK